MESRRNGQRWALCNRQRRAIACTSRFVFPLRARRGSERSEAGRALARLCLTRAAAGESRRRARKGEIVELGAITLYLHREGFELRAADAHNTHTSTEARVCSPFDMSGGYDGQGRAGNVLPSESARPRLSAARTETAHQASINSVSKGGSRSSVESAKTCRRSEEGSNGGRWR